MQTPDQNVGEHISTPESKVRKISRLATELFLRMVRPASYEAERNLRWTVEKTFPHRFQVNPSYVDPELWATDPAYAQQLQRYQLQNAAQVPAQVALNSTVEQPAAQVAYQQPQPTYPAAQVGPDREQVPADDYIHSGEQIASDIKQWLESGAAIPSQGEQIS